MKTLLVSVLIIFCSFNQQTTSIADLCTLLQKKLEAKAHNSKPSKVICDKYGNIEFYSNNPDSPNQKLVFNLFDIQTKIDQIEWVNGQKPFELTIFCQTKCISQLNWWKEGSNIYTDEWQWDFINKEDANYVIKCIANIKLKCIKDPNR